MTVSHDKLFTRLLKTRDSLRDVCEELNIEVPDEEQLGVLQCANCYIWRNKANFVLEYNLPVCSFCADMALMRF